MVPKFSVPKNYGSESGDGGEEGGGVGQPSQAETKKNKLGRTSAEFVCRVEKS